MSYGRIESWIYGSGTAGTLAATSDLTIVETTGALSVTVALSLPGLMSSGFLNCLMQWQTALNASALNNTYSVTWNAATQTVAIARTAGVSSFRPVFVGALARVWGYGANPSVAATSFVGDTPSLARFDAVRVGAKTLRPGDRVDLRQYRHGRSESLCFGNHDICDVRILLPRETGERFARSYCAHGRIRIWRDETVLGAYTADDPTGYTDGYVLAVTKVLPMFSADSWMEIEIRMGVPRA